MVLTGKVSSLRRFKDDVSEVKAGMECGIGFDRFNDLKVGDVIDGTVTKLVNFGAFVRVRVADRRYESVMRAPQSALYGEDIVYVVNREDRLEARRVVVRGYDGNDILFTDSDGVTKLPHEIEKYNNPTIRFVTRLFGKLYPM